MGIPHKSARMVEPVPGRSSRRDLRALVVALFALCSTLVSAEARGDGTCVLAGRVVNAITGQPLPGISFWLSMEQSEEGKSRYRSVRTSEDGTFKQMVARNREIAIMWNPTSAGAGYMLDSQWLMKTGNYMRSLGSLTKDKTDLVLKVKLLPVTTLTGKVLNPRGQPAKGATVCFDYRVQPAITNQAGEFVLKIPSAHRDYEIFIASADKESSKVVKLNSRTKRTTVTLERNWQVKGRAIADDRRPAAGLMFRIYPMINNTPLFMLQGSHCKTDAQGRFVATNLTPGVTYVAQWNGSATINEAYRDGSATVTVKRRGPILLHVKRFVDNWRAPGNLCISKGTKCRNLTNFCLSKKDNVLACDGWGKAIRVIGLNDKPIAVWSLGFSPQAIRCREDGTVVVAGPGKIALLDQRGKVLKHSKLPGRTATSVGCCGGDIFVAVGVGMGYNLYRMNSRLEGQKLIVKGLRGCCGQMDIAAKDNVLYVAANSLFKVVKYDRNGKELGRFGERARPGVEGFEGCCEPKNLCLDSEGYLYAAESDKCGVKKFTRDGRYLGSMGTVNGIRGCVRVTIALPKDCSRIYMLDTGRNIIRMLRPPVKKRGVVI